MEIIPSILSHDPDEARSMLAMCEDKVRRVHIDIIDGVFASNKTITPIVFEDSDTKVFLDYHLMVNEPVNWIEQCARGVGDRVIGQIEMMENQLEFLKSVQDAGMDVGLAIDLDTDVSEIETSILADLDVILVMSVKAGFGGQEFSNSAIEKIKTLALMREAHGYSFDICDDGGITTQTVDDVVVAGVNQVAVGRRIFEGDLEDNLANFLKAAEKSVEVEI